MSELDDPAFMQARALGAIFCAVWPACVGVEDRSLEQTVERVRELVRRAESDRTTKALALLDAVERIDRSDMRSFAIAGMQAPQMDGTRITGRAARWPHTPGSERAPHLHGLLVALAAKLPAWVDGDERSPQPAHDGANSPGILDGSTARNDTGK